MPTDKLGRGSVFPGELDHYKVYRVLDEQKIPGKVLKLRDQFGSDEAKLGLPLYFAVPVTKRHGDRANPIYNNRAHLLIFSITSREFQKTIKLRNQFTKGTSVRVVRSLMLAAPSLKLKWKPL